MANRFERGYVPPQPAKRRSSGGVVVAPATATQAETDLVPLAGAFCSVYTYASTDSDANWSDTDNFLITPSGQWLSRTDDFTSELFARVADTWGSGDGSSSFTAPNLRETYRQPFLVSKAPTVYTTIGAYGSGNISDHTHDWTNIYPGYKLYGQPTTGGQRGNWNTNNTPVVSGNWIAAPGWDDNPDTNQPVNNRLQTWGNPGWDWHCPTALGLRSYMMTRDGGYTLPLGYMFAHMGLFSDVGTIITANPKLLVPTGQIVTAADYPEYVAAFGTSLPDMTGRFLRQDIAGSGYQPGSQPYDRMGIVATGLRNYSSSSFASHSHNWPGANPSPGFALGQQFSQQWNQPREAQTSPTGSWYSQAKSSAYVVGPGNETRPYNVNVCYFIKVLP